MYTLYTHAWLDAIYLFKSRFQHTIWWRLYTNHLKYVPFYITELRYSHNNTLHIYTMPKPEHEGQYRVDSQKPHTEDQVCHHYDMVYSI